MSEETTIHVRILGDGTVWQELPDGSLVPAVDDTDLERVKNMTEEEIEANALSDPDNPPLTPEQLERMMRVPNAKRIREDLGMSQREFADQFGLPIQYVREWEARGANPSVVSQLLLRVIHTHPDAVVDAIKQYRARADVDARNMEADITHEIEAPGYRAAG